MEQAVQLPGVLPPSIQVISILEGSITICTFFKSESTHWRVDTSDNFKHLSNICSALIFQNTYLAEINFSCLAPFRPGRPAGSQLKIASTVERQRGDWRCTVNSVLL